MGTPGQPGKRKRKAEGQEPPTPTSLAGRKLDDTICHICRDYLTDPVTIQCGHEFCRVCISQRCAGVETATCPLCGETFQKRSNMQVEARTLSRSENVNGQEQEAISTQQQELRDKLQAELRWRRAQLYAVDVTLDPDTANPRLILSEDRKRVRFGDTWQDLPDNPERFDLCVGVLGTERFIGGRHYWEVEVGDKTEWTLGVCRESVNRKGKIIWTPEDGYWAVWLRDGGYKALTSPPTSLPVSVRPSQVGIFLDYEVGEVSFYNVTDRSHLYTFTGTFSEMLCPYFNPGVGSGGTNTAPLIISPVPAQDGGNLCP
ncbi:E3 ubiquitin-protein ligase TRIM39-like [Mauremys reevesii]|uniref:E3 ubiquitin-protein ligase TRIM39-like n=1 Tax=Mauremys reevesii TaxID=260615 RepID=UPI00193F2339|nr:E3 ubiquitin-protein ligase TRIM39-like [Mauremys reevesii]